MLRYGLSRWIPSREAGWLVLSPTMIANLIGCLAIGVAVTLLARSPEGWRLLVITGLLGSLTTFSTFSFETVLLVQRQSYVAAATNAIGSVLVGLIAVVAGMGIAGAFSRG